MWFRWKSDRLVRPSVRLVAQSRVMRKPFPPLDLGTAPASDEVEVSTVRLGASETVIERLSDVLASDELERAARFRFLRLRERYIQARATLRYLLAPHVGCSPKDLVFSYGVGGKPSVQGNASLRFNVSHSFDVAVYAVGWGCELGVDVEQIRPLKDLDALAAHYFCPEEHGDLTRLASDERVPAFFRCWTRKEAYVKAVGDGLGIALDSFRVTLLPGAPAAFVHIGHVTAHDWRLHDLAPVPGYAGALAYRGALRRLVMRPPTTVEALFGG